MSAVCDLHQVSDNSSLFSFSARNLKVLNLGLYDLIAFICLCTVSESCSYVNLLFNDKLLLAAISGVHLVWQRSNYLRLLMREETLCLFFPPISLVCKTQYHRSFTHCLKDKHHMHVHMDPTGKYVFGVLAPSSSLLVTTSATTLNTIAMNPPNTVIAPKIAEGPLPNWCTRVTLNYIVFF